MTLELRARAAAAALAVFGFNPGQRRGPDGRWIKMGGRGSAGRRAGGADPAQDRLYRERREAYNQTALDAIESRRTFVEPDRVPELLQVRQMEPGPVRDGIIDALAEEHNAALGPDTFEQPLVPPRPGAVRTATGEAAPGSRKPLDAPYEQRRAALARSVRAGARDEVKLAQGMMGETRLFELADGTRAVYKRATRDHVGGYDRPVFTKKDQVDAEELTARVAAAIGAPAPAVHRMGEDEIAMEFVDGADPDIAWAGKPGARKRAVDTPEGIRLGLLDMLVQNSDRHEGNFLIDADGKPVGIDHGLAFSKSYELLDSGPQLVSGASPQVTGNFALGHFFDPMRGYKPNPLTQRDVAKVRRKLEALRGRFERMGRADWHEAMMRRFEFIAANASGQTDIY